MPIFQNGVAVQNTYVVVGTAFLLLGGACTSQPAVDPSGPNGRGGLGATNVPWSEKTRSERTDWMGLEVFPKMKMAFAEYDAGSFGSFQCQTCHGEHMEESDFTMPSDLFALSATDPVGQAAVYDEEITGFMVNIVVPEMAKLLDTSPYNPETQQGFGCFGCHPSE